MVLDTKTATNKALPQAGLKFFIKNFVYLCSEVI